MLRSDYLIIRYNTLIIQILMLSQLDNSVLRGPQLFWGDAMARQVSPAPPPFMRRLLGPILWRAASRVLPNKHLKPRSRSMRQSCRREIILEDT